MRIKDDCYRIKNFYNYTTCQPNITFKKYLDMKDVYYDYADNCKEDYVLTYHEWLLTEWIKFKEKEHDEDKNNRIKSRRYKQREHIHI